MSDWHQNHEDASVTWCSLHLIKQTKQVISQTTVISNIKLSILKKEEYDIWAMEMEHYLEYIDSEVGGNSKETPEDFIWKGCVIRKILPPVYCCQNSAIEESKVRLEYSCLWPFPRKTYEKNFHGMDDAKKSGSIRLHGQSGNDLRTKPDVDTLSIDDLYNNLRVFEQEIQGCLQNILQVLKMLRKEAHAGFDEKLFIPLANQSETRTWLLKTWKQIDDFGTLEVQQTGAHDGKKSRIHFIIVKKQDNILEKIIHSLGLCWLQWMMVIVTLAARTRNEMKRQIMLSWLHRLTVCEANEIYEKDEKLKRYRRIGMKAVKEKEQLQKTVDSWKDSSKNLWRLINSGMSSNDKLGLGFEIQSNDEVLSYEEEMNFSVFKCSKEDSIGKPSYSRFTKTNDFKGVPHPLSGDYTPKPQEEIDDSLYVYGKKGPQKPEISVSDDNSSEHSTCQSNDSEGSCGNTSEHSFETESESLSEPNEMSKSRLEVTNEKDVSAPKSKEVEPSCVSHIKTPRQPLKDKETHKVNRKNWNDMMERELGEGYSFTKKKCFVCGSLSHLIKDCDYYEKKMAREAEVKRVVNTGNGVAKPVWTNANRINHSNKFVPRSVQLNAGRPNFNSVRPNINTGRTNINSVRPKVNAVSPKVNTVRFRQPVPNKTSNSSSPKRPQMNQMNQRRDFSKSYSSVRRPFEKTTAQMSHSNAVMGSWGSAVKTSASYNWRNSRPNFHYNSGPTFNRTVNAKGPQGRPKPEKAWVPKRN
ncbi:hypothetical protein Tco_0854145 [Tanacetum coccineum]